MGPAGGAQAVGSQHRLDSVAARRMTRRNNRQETWMIGNKLAMNASDDFLLAGMRTGGKPKRAWPNLMTQLLELRGIDRQEPRPPL